MHGPVESLCADEEARVELVQVPAQPLLDPSPFVDEVLAVINQQLELSKRLLVRARTTQPRFAQGGAAPAPAANTGNGRQTIAARIESNEAVATRVKRILPAGQSIDQASSGFKNQNQFVGALHASQNLNIPFDQLKEKMTGDKPMSLDNAVRALRPDMPQDQAKKEIKKAQAMAKTTSTVPPKPKN